VTSPPKLVWRIAAAALWFISVVCLSKAIVGGVTAEESLYNPHLTAADRVTIQQESKISDRWSAVGWILQFATAAVLSFGLKSPRIVRRIFVSLGILIAIDGIALLLTVVIIPH
jgi:hypothetical protein